VALFRSKEKNVAVYAERRDWDADEGYVITERYGRSYYEGRAFATHDDAMAAAKSIGETERPYGVWVVPADDDARSREVLVYEETASPEELAASDAKDVALLHGAELAFGNYKDYVGSADQEEDLPKLAEAMHAQLPARLAPLSIGEIPLRVSVDYASETKVVLHIFGGFTLPYGRVHDRRSERLAKDSTARQGPTA
jgi:hypothetical protein